MFDNDVDKVLAEGQQFVEKLNKAVAGAQTKADDVQKEIAKLEAKRNAFDLKVRKGTIVSDRISSLITVSDEDLNMDGIPDSEQEQE